MLTENGNGDGTILWERDIQTRSINLTSSIHTRTARIRRFQKSPLSISFLKRCVFGHRQRIQARFPPVGQSGSKNSRRFQRETDRPADRELRNNEAMIKRSDFREKNNDRFISGFLAVTELRQIFLNSPSYKVIFYITEVKLLLQFSSQSLVLP